MARWQADGCDVRVLARRPGHDAAVEWVPGDLATGEGVAEAVAGVETVIHAATAVGHFVHVPGRTRRF